MSLRAGSLRFSRSMRVEQISYVQQARDSRPKWVRVSLHRESEYPNAMSSVSSGRERTSFRVKSSFPNVQEFILYS